MKEWNVYRRRRRAARIWFVIMIPMLFGLMFVSAWLELPFWASGALFIAICMVWGVLNLRWVYFPCPRCGRPLHGTWCYVNTVAGRCIHCGLRLYEEIQSTRSGGA